MYMSYQKYVHLDTFTSTPPTLSSSIAGLSLPFTGKQEPLRPQLGLFSIGIEDDADLVLGWSAKDIQLALKIISHLHGL
jgi:hypothetical protein